MTQYAIPTIDFAPFLAGTEAQRREVVTALGQAAETYGFMTLVGHGIPAPVIADAFQAGMEFFALPLETKMAIQERRTNRG